MLQKLYAGIAVDVSKIDALTVEPGSTSDGNCHFYYVVMYVCGARIIVKPCKTFDDADAILDMLSDEFNRKNFKNKNFTKESAKDSDA